MLIIGCGWVGLLRDGFENSVFDVLLLSHAELMDFPAKLWRYLPEFRGQLRLNPLIGGLQSLTVFAVE